MNFWRSHAYFARQLRLLTHLLIMTHRLFNPTPIFAPRDFTPIERKPICVEIGAGRGKHACLFARNHPDKTLFAIERTKDKFHSLQKSHEILALNNLHPIHADAIAWITHAVYPKTIERLFILYPNPEPHNKNQRWVNMPFFEFLLSRMADGGQITLASNITDYINEAEDRLVNHWRLPCVRNVIDSSSARTHFEIKYLARGECCEELIITKPIGHQTRFDDFLPKGGV